MGTFSMIGTAYSGLAAARAALETTGQNVANVSTPGYTRQRVDQVSLSGVSNTSLYTTGLNIGTGTAVTGITRLNDSIVDTQVRDTASSSGYWDTASAALSSVETSLNEPGSSGLSETLNTFWSAWGSMGNNGGSNAAAATLLSASNTLTTRISAGYTAASQAWSAARSTTANTVQTVNDAAKQIATLNDAIMRTTARGGNANELLDQRSTALTNLATLTGATSRQNANGTIDVVLGGNTIVSGATTRAIALVGATTLTAAGTNALHLEFTDHPGAAVTLGGGTVAAQLATLAGTAAGGTGGTYAEAAKVYNDLATALSQPASVAGSLNALHAAGQTSTGATGLSFFSATGAGPAALSLTVVPTSVAGIAAASTSAGKLDGSVADAISQLGQAPGSPDSQWATYVSQLGAQSKSAATQSTLAGTAAAAAVTSQTSQSGVDLDEETSNLVVFQHAYQAAARVMTAVDQMLDTLINHTGLVGS